MRRSTRTKRITAAICTIGLTFTLTAGSAAWAYFTDMDELYGRVNTLRVEASQANLRASLISFRNDYLTHTGYVQAINDSDAAFPLTATITSAAPMAARFQLTAWQAAAPADCTPTAPVGADAITGTWANLTLATEQTVPSRALLTFCMRTTVDGRQTIASPTGVGVGPAFTYTVSLSKTGWQSATHVVNYNLSTSNIFPLDYSRANLTRASNYVTVQANGQCLETTGALYDNATALIFWTCSGNIKQRWQLVPLDDSDRSLVMMRFQRDVRYAAGHDGTRLTLRDADPTDPTQLWRIQTTGTSHRLVNEATGLCMQAIRNSTGAPWVRCDSSTLDLTLTPHPLQLRSTTGGLLGGLEGIIAFNAPNMNTINGFALQVNDGGTWVNVPLTFDATASNANFAASALRGSGVRELRIVDGRGSTLYGGLTVNVQQPGLLGGGSLTPVAGWDPA